MSEDHSRLRAVVEPVVAALGYDLEDLDVKNPQGRRTLIVAIDADAGIGVDDIARVSREISVALDVEDPMGESAYQLEVTSRGAARPLTLPRHWRRNEGRRVRIKLTDGGVVEGRIDEHDDTGALIEGRRIAYADVAKATVQIDLRRN